MKKQGKGLKLHRETVRVLTHDRLLEQARGGFTCSFLCNEDMTCDGCVTGNIGCI